MRSTREGFLIEAREIADFILPQRYSWLHANAGKRRRHSLNVRILDNTATRAVRVLAAGMMAGITSPGRPWFKLKSENPAESDYWNVVEKRMQTVMAQSNYYTSKATQYLNMVLFGPAPVIIYQDYEDVIRCYNPCAGEYMIAHDAKQRVDTLARDFFYTAAQIKGEFTDRTPDKVKVALSRPGGSETNYLIGHLIEPNVQPIDGLSAQAVPPHFKYREIYWLMGDTSLLRIKGYEDAPFNCPRWDVIQNDPYGISAAMDAIGDVKQLQKTQLRKAEAIDKQVRPPMMADYWLKDHEADLVPGGMTFVPSVANNGGMRPVYTIEPNLENMVADHEDTRQRIEATFFKDLFMMISQLDTVRSATEIDARQQEKLMQLGPVLERFQSESLDKDIYRIYGIMDRGGLLPPKPPGMATALPKVKYTSILSQMQQAAGTASIERLYQFAGNLAGILPEVLDKFDIDDTIDEYAEMLGTPPRILLSQDQVDAKRKARAQQQQQQTALQNSMAAVQGAQTLSQTDVGGGINALQAMVGNQGAGGSQAA